MYLLHQTLYKCVSNDLAILKYGIHYQSKDLSIGRIQHTITMQLKLRLEAFLLPMNPLHLYDNSTNPVNATDMLEHRTWVIDT